MTMHPETNGSAEKTIRRCLTEHGKPSAGNDEMTVREQLRERLIEVASQAEESAVRYGLAQGLCEADGLDAAQDALVRALELLAQEKLTNQLDNPNWLKVVAKHNVIDRLRRRDRACGPIEYAASAVADRRRDVVESRAALLDAVHEALSQLGEGVRQLLVDHHAGDCTYAETAGRLGLSEEAVNGRLRRAKAELYRLVVAILTARGFDPSELPGRRRRVPRARE